MPKASIRDEHGKTNLRAFENYGFIYGLTLGGVVGVVVVGPHFHEWSFFVCLGIILGCGIGIGVLGHLAVAIAYGSTASGFGVASDTDSGSSDGGGGGD